MICISKIQLIKLNYDEIEETATHEVTHILEKGHDAGFHREHEITKISAWRPPSGVIHITGKGSKTSEKKLRIDKTRCNYHLCRKKRKLEKCRYCKDYFCEEHIRPKPPGMPKFHSTKAEDIDFMEEYHKTGGHPCLVYVDYIEREQKRKKEEYNRALEMALEKEHTEERKIIYMSHEKKHAKRSIQKTKKPHEKYKESHPKKILAESTTKRELEEIIELIKKSDKDIREEKKEIGKTEKEVEKEKRGEETNKRDEEKSKKIRERKIFCKRYLKWFAIFIIIFGFSVCFLLNYPKKTLENLDNGIKISPINETGIIFKNKTIIELIPSNISFKEYLENKDKYNNKNVTLVGFLQNKLEGSITSGIYVDFLVDDFENEIDLLKLTSEQKELFTKKGITKELYNVSGVLKRRYKGLDLEVSKIVPSERPVIEAKKQIIVLEKLNYSKNIAQINSEKKDSFNISKFVNVIKDFFNNII